MSDAKPEETSKNEDKAPAPTNGKTKMDVAKNTTFKYFGAMFMEKKDGQQAVSLTRMLALLCFGMLMWKWSGVTGTVDPEVAKALLDAGINVPMALKASGEIPSTLLYTFWGLLGGKTAESMMALFKGKKGS